MQNKIWRRRVRIQCGRTKIGDALSSVFFKYSIRINFKRDTVIMSYLAKIRMENDQEFVLAI